MALRGVGCHWFCPLGIHWSNICHCYG
uniref:Uncharacterized protein n=1 Tax=Arundo donax TaxID=35708 RepID=A0A0A9EVH0_ARUDO